MDEPLGRAVGNALEVDEAVATLEGRGPDDLTALCLEAAALMVDDPAAVERALHSGAGRETFDAWIRAQGGDPDAARAKAPHVTDVTAHRAGWVEQCHSRAVGEAAMRLGAGRAHKEDTIDPAVGIVVQAKRGDRVKPGQPLAQVHSRGPVDEQAVRACFTIVDREVGRAPVVLEVLRPG
jgi:thymidine phosphorylase